ncbi:YhcN/YlaJ family sporulation lipoprotein [Cohnella sp. GCM10027633]|uniref:YhcN/YlaJ family sporulation lipoprotein n=1 Tax=unclassified Cohnella TaxID=2636738 RepID=UPI00363B79A8
MRKSLWLGTLLLTTALAATGCMEKTGDLGNKNIRPNAVNNERMLGNGTRFADDQRNEMNRVNGDQRVNNNIVGMHGNSHLQMSDQIADQLAAMPGIDGAYVVMTDRNAYVAVNQDRQGANAGSADLDGAAKTRIADKVKSMSPSTENVYVSANPDFAGRMRNFADETKNGHPIQGFLTEFNALVTRIFPAESSRGGTR